MPSPNVQNPDGLGSSNYFVTYAGAVVNTDLVAEGLNACKRIRCQTAGTLFVRRSSDGVQVTLNFLAGETQEVNCTALVAGGTATDVTVYW